MEKRPPAGEVRKRVPRSWVLFSISLLLTLLCFVASTVSSRGSDAADFWIAATARFGLVTILAIANVLAASSVWWFYKDEYQEEQWNATNLFYVLCGYLDRPDSLSRAGVETLIDLLARTNDSMGPYSDEFLENLYEDEGLEELKENWLKQEVNAPWGWGWKDKARNLVLDQFGRIPKDDWRPKRRSGDKPTTHAGSSSGISRDPLDDTAGAP